MLTDPLGDSERIGFRGVSHAGNCSLTRYGVPCDCMAPLLPTECGSCGTMARPVTGNLCDLCTAAGAAVLALLQLRP